MIVSKVITFEAVYKFRFSSVRVSISLKIDSDSKQKAMTIKNNVQQQELWAL